MDQLKLNMVGGEGYGNLTMKADAKGRYKEAAAVTLEHEGSTGSITLESGTTLDSLCGVIADSTATDVAGVVVDFNALLAALRTANVIG